MNILLGNFDQSSVNPIFRKVGLWVMGSLYDFSISVVFDYELASVISTTVWSWSEPLETSLVAQMVKNLPAMQETWLWSLGREDPLEKEMATHSSIPALNPMDRGAWWAIVHGVAKNQMWMSDWHMWSGQNILGTLNWKTVTRKQ